MGIKKDMAGGDLAVEGKGELRWGEWGRRRDGG